MKIYIPEGEYSYAYSKFNDSQANYFLAHPEFNTADTDSVKLSGQNTKTLELDIDANYRNGKVHLHLDGAAESVQISASVSSLLRITPAQYDVAFEAKTADSAYQYTVSRDKSLDMSADAVWKIGSTFVPEVVLNQNIVAENQMLMGKMFFRDGHGNSLTGVKVNRDNFYEAVYPTVTAGAAGVGEQTFSLDKNGGYSSFAIDSSYYYGEGPHYMRVNYDIGQGPQQTADIPFVVGLDFEPRLTPDSDERFEVEQTSNGSVSFTSVTATGYLPVTVELNASSRKRNITFEQYRDGEIISIVSAGYIFAGKDSNSLSAYFNVRQGDKILVNAK
jgi:hypothetical protein